jgi:hypothetical protein
MKKKIVAKRLIMRMPEGNLNMEFETAAWNLMIFQVIFTLENKIQDTLLSQKKEEPFSWFHLIGYHQCYHPDCCSSGW